MHFIQELAPIIDKYAGKDYTIFTILRVYRRGVFLPRAACFGKEFFNEIQ